jgi:galactokinase
MNDALGLILDEARVPEQLARKLGRSYYDPSWEEIAEEEIGPYLPSLPKKLANRILFTVRMQESTKYALELLRQTSPHVTPPRTSRKFEGATSDRMTALGIVMSYQHELLRDLYEVSTPTLEKLRDTLLASGALGAKISGGGLGGSVIALVRDHDTAEGVRSACVASGFPEVWVSTPDEGARVESC